MGPPGVPAGAQLAVGRRTNLLTCQRCAKSWTPAPTLFTGEGVMMMVKATGLVLVLVCDSCDALACFYAEVKNHAIRWSRDTTLG